MIFDDEYNGPRWRYGLTFRPVGFGNVPKGYIIGSDRPHKQFRHGTIDYPRELTTEEVAGFELTRVEE